MNLYDLRDSIDNNDVGKEMYGLIEELYPICRSITGNGARQSLDILKKHIPLTIQEIPTGTQVFDWTVPKEWNIKDACIKNSKGDKVIDFQDSNLHVVNYSVPTRKKMTLAELKDHLHTIPEHPDWIPYRTSYYKETWGFCLSHNQFLKLEDDDYEVLIDSSLKDGHLTYGEYYLSGRSGDEILISCHICHPSLCNDNLSGIAVSTFLAKYLSPLSLKFSYRFLFIPGTIGSITWLSLSESSVSKIKHGLVLACVGDSGRYTYKKSRLGNAEIDRIVMNILKHSGEENKATDFSPYGYDERQYCSPGFNLPVGCFMRTPYGEYPEYHTSADNLDFVQPGYLSASFSMLLSILSVIESNDRYLSLNSKCEPQLGRRGLYDHLGGRADSKARQLAMLWVLNLSDGNHTLLDISDRSGLDFNLIKNAADSLADSGLITVVDKR
jgi:aminopeptidase-like protein